MLNAYETHLLNWYLFNAISGPGHRFLDAKSLVEWLGDELKDCARANPHGTSGGTSKEPETDTHSHKMLMRLTKKHKRKAASSKPKLLRRVRESLRIALASGPPEPDRFAIRLRRLAGATGLDSLDIKILELLLRNHTNWVFNSFFDKVFRHRHHCHGNIDALGVSGILIPICLGCEVAEFRARLRHDGPLLRTGLLRIDIDDGELEFPDRLLRLFHEPAQKDEDIVPLLLDTTSPSELEWSDFEHVAKHRGHIETLLRGALQSRAKGVNILLHGPPGTGKTEFCKVLAERLDAALYVIGEDDSDSLFRRREPDRQQELVFAQRLLANNRNSLLLFDEMVDLFEETSSLAAVFPSMAAPLYGPASSQVLLHRILEESPIPILWTMNNARWASPTILRRMMFALELRTPDINVRTRVWARQLARNDIAATPDETRELAREFAAAPAIAAGATTAARLGDGALDTVRFGVRSLSRLLSCDKPPQRAPAEFELSLIRADTDPQRLADRVAATARRDFSLCLQGPPGTGKSAFVRYLAQRLGLEVICKRASDIMSMWVGESEQNIARAFAEARDAEAFLVFDEADSLLADRRNAFRNWEVSQTNEMLTWMENHPLPFACTTNFVERLDEASLRRFTFKIALDCLTPQQARFAFDKFFSLEPPPELDRVATLTPGDFAVVRRKAEILGCLQEPDTLTDMLRAECEAKPNRQKMIGFLA